MEQSIVGGSEEGCPRLPSQRPIIHPEKVLIDSSSEFITKAKNVESIRGSYYKHLVPINYWVKVK